MPTLDHAPPGFRTPRLDKLRAVGAITEEQWHDGRSDLVEGLFDSEGELCDVLLCGGDRELQWDVIQRHRAMREAHGSLVILGPKILLYADHGARALRPRDHVVTPATIVRLVKRRAVG